MLGENNVDKLTSVVEALLFAAGEPLSFDRLLEITGAEPLALRVALDELSDS